MVAQEAIKLEREAQLLRQRAVAEMNGLVVDAKKGEGRKAEADKDEAPANRKREGVRNKDSSRRQHA